MKKSKTGLCILLVLSIIYGATLFFSNIVLAIAMPTLNAFYTSHPEMLEAFHATTAWETLAAVPRTYFAAMGLLGALSVVGCVLMWNLRRSGYHCYAIAQLLMLALPLLFIGRGFLGLGDVMMTALFLVVYYLQLKRLDVFSPKELPSDDTPTGEQ